MTASFIPCCIKPDFIAQRLRLVVALLLTVGLLLTTTARAEDIQVKFVALEAADEGYQFNADFEIALNPTLERALRKGIVLYFVTELNLLNSRWYWFDEKIAQSRTREGLSYYALTRQYRLSRGTLSQNFGTLREALQVLSRVRNRPLIAHSELKQDTEYTAELRMRLDISALPKPFQVEALGSREWDLSSGTLHWNVRLPAQRLQDGARP